MQFQIISLVICAVLSAAVAEVFFEDKFTEGKFNTFFFFFSLSIVQSNS